MSAIHETRHDIASAAGRFALYPARVAARASRERIEASAEAWLAELDIVPALDRLLAGPLPEETARLLVKHRVLERMAAETAATSEVDRLLDRALASAELRELAERTLRSELAQQLMRELATSPEVRRLAAAQTAGLGADISSALRARANLLDDRVDLRREPRASGYAGIPTRAFALAVDAALIGVIVSCLSAVVALIVSLVGSLRPAWLAGLLLGTGWIVFAAAYFVACWSLAGQTPGMRLLRLRVQDAGATPSVARSSVRMFGLLLAIVPCFAGFAPVLVDSRRRGIHDWLAGTTVARYDVD